MIVRSLCGSSHAAGDNAAFEHLPHAGSDARLTAPVRGCVDPFGNFVFADQGNSVVRRVTPGGHATVIGGRAQRPARVDGPNGDARFYCTMVPLMQAYNGYTVDTHYLISVIAHHHRAVLARHHSIGG